MIKSTPSRLISSIFVPICGLDNPTIRDTKINTVIVFFICILILEKDGISCVVSFLLWYLARWSGLHGRDIGGDDCFQHRGFASRWEHRKNFALGSLGGG